MKKATAYFYLSSSLGILAVSLICSYFGAYESFPYIDIPFHLAGGFSIGISYFALKFLLKSKMRILPKKPLIRNLEVLTLVLIAALFWEVLEGLLLKLYLNSPQYPLSDTLSDLLFGMIGGVLSCLYSTHKIDKKR